MVRGIYMKCSKYIYVLLQVFLLETQMKIVMMLQIDKLTYLQVPMLHWVLRWLYQSRTYLFLQPLAWLDPVEEQQFHSR